jgi:dipeptidyl-peptidase-4
MKLLLTLVCVLVTYSQQTIEPTPEWIYSSENTLLRTATVSWTNTNEAIIYDRLQPNDKRTIEIYNPITKARKALVNRSKAATSLESLFPKFKNTVPKPESFSADGTKGLYIMNDDIVVLDFKTSQFKRLTKTADVEKSANFSPNGLMVAFVRNNNLIIVDIKTGKETAVTSSGTDVLLNGTLSWVYWEEIFERNDKGYFWSDDSKSIAFFETDESQVDLIYYVDFKPDVQRVITQRYPKAGNANPAIRLGVFSLHSKQTVWYDKSAFDYEYLIRVNWLPNNKEVAVQTMNRRQDNVNLYFVGAEESKVRHILKETDPSWVNTHNDLHFLKKSDQFIWRSEQTGFAHLYLYNMDGKRQNAITHGDFAIATAASGRVGQGQAVAAIDEDNKWVYYTSMEASSIERQLYRIDFDGKNKKRITEEAGQHRINFSPNAHFFFDRYSRIDRSPELSLHSANGKQVAIISKAQTELQKKLGLHYPELFTIKARDGFELPAQLLKPKDFDPKKSYGLILKIYGGPSAPSVSNSFQYELLYNQNLAKNGYFVLSVDNRAATAISKTLENLFAVQSMSEGALPDILDAVKHMKALPYIDGERVGLWGWSGGGTFTLSAMTHSKEFKAGISGAPNTDGRYYDTKWMEMYVKDPKRYETSSLVRAAKNLHGKIMFMHGTYDDNVHIQHTYAVVDELIKAGKLYEMMIYPMRKHGFSDRPALIHRYNTMLDFWRRNL